MRCWRSGKIRSRHIWKELEIGRRLVAGGKGLAWVRLREVLEALAFIEAFPPAQILWNAGHMDVPLHCFFRTKHEPIFKIKHIEIEPMRVLVRLEYGKASKEQIKREEIVLRRDSKLRLELATRREV